jgi:DNA-binding response OmpR family regulator
VPAPRALLVEDHRHLGALIARTLERQGLQVRHVRTLGEACEALDREYALVVLDVMLPDGSGLDVLRRMRAAGRDTPVLIVSARDTVDDRVAGLDGGADDYLVKPFSDRELVARVHALLRRPQRFRVIQAGVLAIDPTTHAATVGDRTLDLSPKEGALLELLARHAGHTVPRTVLMDGLWGFRFDGLDNALEAHISTLRRHLRARGVAVRILTVRRVGYRLDVVPTATAPAP